MMRPSQFKLRSCRARDTPLETSLGLSSAREAEDVGMQPQRSLQSAWPQIEISGGGSQMVKKVGPVSVHVV